MIIENPNRSENLMEELLKVWVDSVKETHTFLSENNILEIKPFVKEGLEQIKNLIVVYEDHEAVGFMGIEDDKIEMLFLSPLCFGKGLGKILISKAINEYNVIYVDVNEQNTNAVSFYKHFNFEVFERRDEDEQGHPFPILKMKSKLLH